MENHLNAIQLDYYKISSVDNADALAIVYKQILNLSKQVSVSYRGDAHKIEFLSEAVFGHPWPKEPLSHIATAGIPFPQIYAKLWIAVQWELENAYASVQSLPASVLNTSTPKEQHKNYFTYLGKYVRIAFGERSWSSCKRVCFKCASESYFVKRCSHPVSFSLAAVSKIHNLQSNKTLTANHIVLVYYCR